MPANSRVDTPGRKIRIDVIDKIVEDSVTYYILPNDSAISEDDWTEESAASGDYWSYLFKSDELGLLEHYMNASEEEVNTLCHVIMLGDTSSQSFQHALFSVLKSI